jgi:hypothetical protein
MKILGLFLYLRTMGKELQEIARSRKFVLRTKRSVLVNLSHYSLNAIFERFLAAFRSQFVAYPWVCSPPSNQKSAEISSLRLTG